MHPSIPVFFIVIAAILNAVVGMVLQFKRFKFEMESRQNANQYPKMRLATRLGNPKKPLKQT